MSDEDQRLKVARPPESLRGQVLAKLRGAILDGTFPAGERLVERRLCDLLGVSRTLVREALRHLETEGLVRTVPYKGPAVAAITADEVRQLYEIRAALEGLAAKQFADRGTAEDLARLSDALERIERAVEAGDAPGHRAAIEQFYDALMQGAGNALLHASVSAQRQRLARLRAISLARAHRASESLEEKRTIVAAIRARDGEAARRASESHIACSAAAVMEMLEVHSLAPGVVEPTSD